jgi:hypothetical protein
MPAQEKLVRNRHVRGIGGQQKNCANREFLVDDFF